MFARSIDTHVPPCCRAIGCVHILSHACAACPCQLLVSFQSLLTLWLIGWTHELAFHEGIQILFGLASRFWMMVLPFGAALMLNGQSVSRLGFGLVVASASSASVAFQAAQAVWCAPIADDAATTVAGKKHQAKGSDKDATPEVHQGTRLFSLREAISTKYALPGEKGMKNAAAACGTGAMWYQHQLLELQHVAGVDGRVEDVLTAQDCTFVLLFALLALGVNWHICQAGVELEEREASQTEQYGRVAWRLRRSDAAAAALRVITPSMVVIAALEPVLLEPLSRLMGLWPVPAAVPPYM
jgi:hypothetical protein